MVQCMDNAICQEYKFIGHNLEIRSTYQNNRYII